jgi:phosphatidate cytidylyltransferase
MFKKNNLSIRLSSALVAGSIFFGSYFYSVYLFTILLCLAFLIILIFEWPKLCRKNKQLWLLTPIYPVGPMILLIGHLLWYEANIWIPIFPFFIAWAADTGGYVFGKLFGHHKICPGISPKKSWEGLFGSFLFVCPIVFWMYGDFVGLPHFTGEIVVRALTLSFVLTFAALAGDLFESFLKRRANLKDTGAIMPGHGGFLDRFDSVFGVAVALVIRWFLL